MQAWHLWLIAGILLFVLEIFTPGFFVACLGIASLAAAVPAGLGAGTDVQLLTFAVATVVAFVAVRPVVIKTLHASSGKAKTNVDALVGKTGIVTEKIDPATRKGRAIIEGDDWRAVSADDAVIESGVRVTVVRVDGTQLFVRPA